MAPEASVLASQSASSSFPKDLKKEGSKPVVAAAAPSVDTERTGGEGTEGVRAEGERTEGVRAEGERTEEARTEERREAEGSGQPITSESMAPVPPASRQGQWLVASHRNPTFGARISLFVVVCKSCTLSLSLSHRFR